MKGFLVLLLMGWTTGFVSAQQTGLSSFPALAGARPEPDNGPLDETLTRQLPGFQIPGTGSGGFGGAGPMPESAGESLGTIQMEVPVGAEELAGWARGLKLKAPLKVTDPVTGDTYQSKSIKSLLIRSLATSQVARKSADTIRDIPVRGADSGFFPGSDFNLAKDQIRVYRIELSSYHLQQLTANVNNVQLVCDFPIAEIGQYDAVIVVPEAMAQVPGAGTGTGVLPPVSTPPASTPIFGGAPPLANQTPKLEPIGSSQAGSGGFGFPRGGGGGGFGGGNADANTVPRQPIQPPPGGMTQAEFESRMASMQSQLQNQMFSMQQRHDEESGRWRQQNRQLTDKINELETDALRPDRYAQKLDLGDPPGSAIGNGKLPPVLNQTSADGEGKLTNLKQDASNDKQTRRSSGNEQFMLVVLLFSSIGANIFLFWQCRSYYGRYGDLADELRQMFSSAA